MINNDFSLLIKNGKEVDTISNTYGQQNNRNGPYDIVILYSRDGRKGKSGDDTKAQNCRRYPYKRELAKEVKDDKCHKEKEKGKNEGKITN